MDYRDLPGVGLKANRDYFHLLTYVTMEMGTYVDVFVHNSYSFDFLMRYEPLPKYVRR